MDLYEINKIPKSGPHMMLPANDATTQEIHVETGCFQAKSLPASLRTAKTHKIMWQKSK